MTRVAVKQNLEDTRTLTGIDQRCDVVDEDGKVIVSEGHFCGFSSQELGGPLTHAKVKYFIGDDLVEERPIYSIFSLDKVFFVETWENYQCRTK